MARDLFGHLGLPSRDHSRTGEPIYSTLFSLLTGCYFGEYDKALRACVLVDADITWYARKDGGRLVAWSHGAHWNP